jgi:hypothetical protein
VLGGRANGGFSPYTHNKEKERSLILRCNGRKIKRDKKFGNIGEGMDIRRTVGCSKQEHW